MKCYVAFKTEDELKTHLDIEHSMGKGVVEKGGKIKANALLGFQDEEEDKEDFDRDGDTRGGRGGRGRGRGGRGGAREMKEHHRIKDSEGVDFNYYFG